MEYCEKEGIYKHPVYGCIEYDLLWHLLEEVSSYKWPSFPVSTKPYFDRYHESIITYLVRMHNEPKSFGRPFCKKIVDTMLYHNYVLCMGGTLEILFIIFRFHPKLVRCKINTLLRNLQTQRICSFDRMFIYSILTQPVIDTFAYKRSIYRKMVQMLGIDVNDPALTFIYGMQGNRHVYIGNGQFDMVMNIFNTYPTLEACFPSKEYCIDIMPYTSVCTDCITSPESTYWKREGWINNRNRGCGRCRVKEHALIAYDAYTKIKIEFTLFDKLFHFLFVESR